MTRLNHAVLITLAATLLAAPAAGAAPALTADTLDDSRALATRWLDNLAALRALPALAVTVVIRGEPVYTHATGAADREERAPTTVDTPFYAGSLSKLVTTIAILQLVDAGRLALGDPLAKHLPELHLGADGRAAAAITLEDLLLHRSGLPREGATPYWMTYDFPAWRALATSLDRQPLDFAEGTQTAYSNVGMALLGRVVERVSGEPYADYVARHVLGPLRMADSTARFGVGPAARVAAAWSARSSHVATNGGRFPRGAGDPRAFAPAFGLVSTARDLGRLIAFFQRPDATPGVLSESGVAQMLRPRAPPSPGPELRALGFDADSLNGRAAASHGGWFTGHKSFVILDLPDEIGVVVLGSADDTPAKDIAERLALLFAEAPLVARREPHPDDPAPACLRGLVGAYGSGWIPDREIVLLSDGLYQYEPASDPRSPVRYGLRALVPAGPDAFRAGTADGQLLRFERGPGGVGRRILLDRGLTWLDRYPEPAPPGP